MRCRRDGPSWGGGEPSGAGRRYFLMDHELRVSWDLIFWLHPLVFLDPGPGLGGWVSWGDVHGHGRTVNARHEGFCRRRGASSGRGAFFAWWWPPDDDFPGRVFWRAWSEWRNITTMTLIVRQHSEAYCSTVCARLSVSGCLSAVFCLRLSVCGCLTMIVRLWLSVFGCLSAVVCLRAHYARTL